MKRRHLLAGAAALPFAGMAAQVQGANLRFDPSDDPAVRAFHVWRDAWQQMNDSYGPDAGEDDEYEAMQDRLHDAEWEALTALAGTVATSQTGVLGQMIAALDMIGDMKAGGKLGDPDSYTFGNVKDDLDGKLLTSMLTGAQRLA